MLKENAEKRLLSFIECYAVSIWTFWIVASLNRCENGKSSPLFIGKAASVRLWCLFVKRSSIWHLMVSEHRRECFVIEPNINSIRFALNVQGPIQLCLIIRQNQSCQDKSNCFSVWFHMMNTPRSEIAIRYLIWNEELIYPINVVLTWEPEVKIHRLRCTIYSEICRVRYIAQFDTAELIE